MNLKLQIRNGQLLDWADLNRSHVIGGNARL